VGKLANLYLILSSSSAAVGWGPALEVVLTTADERPASAHWWATPGPLGTRLVRLDGQVGVVVNAEKHVLDPSGVSGEVARQLERIAQQMGLGAGGEAVGRSETAPGSEPVKQGFTREAGSLRYGGGRR